MGLLDKVENTETKEEKKTAKPVAKAVAKAVPKATAKAVPKTAKKATPKPAKSSKPKKENEEKIRPTGLPEGYELAGKMPRYIGWLINVAWNFGVLVGTLSVFLFSDSDFTIGFAAAGLMILFNWLVIPIWMGRNVGEFVSRTKYINSSGNKPLFIHAILNNSLGYLFLLGLAMVAMNINQNGDVKFAAVGAVLMLMWIINFFFKKNSDFSQGIFDLAFSTYLVKHISTGNETGWAARFEGLGDFGDKWQKKQEERRIKSEEKAKARSANQETDADNSEANTEESVD